MKFCPNCGHQVIEGKKFCSNCGRNLTVTENQEAAVSQNEDKPQELLQNHISEGNQYSANNNMAGTYQQQPNSTMEGNFVGQVGYNNGYSVQPIVQKKPKKPMTKAAKIILAVVLLIVVAAGAFFGIGTYITGRSYVLNKIESAISKNDAKELSKYLYSSDDALKINEENTKALLELINDTPNYKDKLIGALKNGQKFDSFSMSQHKKELIFFKAYGLDIKGQSISLSANYKGTEFMLDGKSVGKAENENTPQKFGPFMPGIYDLQFVLTNDYGTSTIKRNITINGAGVYEDGTFDLKVVYPYFPVDGFYPVVDGKAIKQTLKQDNNVVGPFPKDSSSKIAFEKEYSWGKLRSKEYSVNSSDSSGYINELVMKDSDILKSMAPDVKNFLYSYFDGISSLDATKLQNASVKMQQDFVTTVGYYSTTGEAALHKASINTDVLWLDGTIYGNSDKFTVYVPLEYQLHGNDYKEVFTIYLYYDESKKQWLVDSFSMGGTNSDNLLELK